MSFLSHPGAQHVKTKKLDLHPAFAYRRKHYCWQVALLQSLLPLIFALAI